MNEPFENNIKSRAEIQDGCVKKEKPVRRKALNINIK